MMDARELIGGDYLDARDLQGRQVTAAIEGFRTQTMEDLKKEIKNKGIIRLKHAKKEWVLNTTNIKCLMAMFGDETDDWIGRAITLYPIKEPKSDSGLAIRVYGSPDIKETFTFTTKIGRTPKKFTMHKTQPRRGGAARQHPESESARDAEYDGIPGGDTFADGHADPAWAQEG
jgi:hypothetical protein